MYLRCVHIKLIFDLFKVVVWEKNSDTAFDSPSGGKTNIVNMFSDTCGYLFMCY